MSIIGHNSNENKELKSPKLIIDITDIYDQRARKRKELQFYTAELQKLMDKMGMLQHEIGVTETIIRLIENEQVMDIEEAIREKRKSIK